MDPVSLAGLGLSATSVAFQLFAGCIKGFVLLSTAHDLGKDSSTLLCMLNLQELHLTEWARRAGLLGADGTLDKCLNENVVHAVLQELRDLLLDTDKLKARYKLGLVAKSFSRQDPSVDVRSPVVQGILGNAISNEIRGDIMYRACLIQTKNSFPQRLWWAAVDKVKFEELVEKIRSFIRELWLLLDPWRQDDMSKSLQTIVSNVIGMSSKIDDLWSLRETILQSSNGLDASDSQKNTSPLASVAAIKAARIDFEASRDENGSTTQNPANGQDQSQLEQFSKKSLENLNKDNIKEFSPMRNNPEMGIAKYNGESVFIEWKSLPYHFRSKIIERAQNLAILLNVSKHPDFRSLHCRGLARDTDGDRIAFVYDLPLTSPEALPRSLRTMFGSNPSVTERLKLALEITLSVKYFHTAGWLHKDLRSENILFFSSEELVAPLLSPPSNPILGGFAFSRLNSPSEISEQPSADPQRDVYRHPDAMGEPSASFSAIKDVYALGTILLEIGEWRSLKGLVDRVIDVGKPDVPLTQLAQVKPFLLDEGPRGGLGMLRFRMGDIYARVTKMMLSGEVPGIFQASQETAEVFRPGLLDVAIRELERCVA